MSKEALAKVVQRAISDAGFRRQLNSNPAGALRGFDLSPDEASALRTGDAGRLSTLGVDQRMSKSFALGGMAAATRMAQSDLSADNPAMFDDGTAGVGRTVIPADPRTAGSADASGSEAIRAKLPIDSDRVVAADVDGGTGGTSTVRAGGDDYKFAGRQAPEAAGTRTGDDWKFADRADAQANAAPVEGSPEADAAQNASGSGMASYPAHHGLAGPSGTESVRAGDDWARSASVADSGRSGTARLDDATGGASGGANVPNDDPDGFLAANANADLSGGATGDGTAFLDESEAYLTKVGYDEKAADSAVTDAHDRGDGITSIEDGADDGPATVDDGGPTLTP